jgi:hypothetical protein
MPANAVQAIFALSVLREGSGEARGWVNRLDEAARMLQR